MKVGCCHTAARGRTPSKADRASRGGRMYKCVYGPSRTPADDVQCSRAPIQGPESRPNSEYMRPCPHRDPCPNHRPDPPLPSYILSLRPFPLPSPLFPLISPTQLRLYCSHTHAKPQQGYGAALPVPLKVHPGPLCHPERRQVPVCLRKGAPPSLR